MTRARRLASTLALAAVLALALAARADAAATEGARAPSENAVGPEGRVSARRLAGSGRWREEARPPPPAPPAPPMTSKERLRASFEAAREEVERRPCAPSGVDGGRAAKCAHVRQTEACEGRLKTYLEYAYCDDAGSTTTVGPIVVLLLMAVGSTYALAVAAGTFFVPALEYVSTLMRLTPEAAGVTLLALGNGAPDLYAQVSEISEGVLPNLNVVIGSTLGSGFFIATVVLGVVILSAPNEHVVINKDILGASIGLFAMANIALMLAMCLGKFKTWYTAFFFFAYAAYLSFMVVQDRSQERAPKQRPDVETASDKREEPLFDLAAAKGGPDDIKGSVRPMKTTSKDGDGIIASCTADMNVYEKRASWITIPIRVAMAYTMPVVRAGSMDKVYAIALGFMGPLFFLCAPGNDFLSALGGSDTMTTFVLNVLVSALCCFGVSYVVSTQYKTAPLPAATEFASMFAFVQSICWMHLMSDELVLALGALSKIAGVDEEIFGVSFVAWGDGLGDLIACRAVAKAGQVTMAVVACFAGPVFNLLIGLASSIAFLTYVIGDMPYRVKQGELILSIGCLFTVMFTISQLVNKSPKEFEMKRTVALASFATYGAFLIAYFLCEARILFAQA
ncbi:putative sodium/calcium exchanger protein [Ostreococcus tauri]|uniref:Putative sodium/calcium exchanger protein n=1 Tax=Ostreococcus tauri TaxID=70448 RepID=A0A1Y5IMG4_OSTTA|nr:putative sodium/calcium exchanger protein [Ostreococcus tauri]